MISSLKQNFVLWFTGLSGSGKTTIANALAKALQDKGLRIDILDGDVVRNKLHRHLGFTPDDIKENNFLIAQLCVRRQKAFDVILVPIISPFKEVRLKAREMIGEAFVEIYVKASLKELVKRDVKGLYKKALKGEMNNLIGFCKDIPYEEPRCPEIIVDTEKEDVLQGVNKILEYLYSPCTLNH